MAEDLGHNVSTKKARNGTLDFWKGIAALSVCFCHIRFPGNVGSVMSAIGTLGVTFFFLISGYALYDPSSDKETMARKILGRFKRNLLITLIACVVCFIYTCIDRMLYGNLGEYLLGFKDPVIYLQMLFPGDFGIISGQPLWFMASLLFAYILFWIVYLFGLHDKIHYLLIPSMVLRIAGEMAVSSLGLDFHLCSNAIVAAFPVMLLGFTVNKFQDRITLSNVTLIISAAVSLLLVIITAIFRHGGVDLAPIFKILLAVLLFVICLRYKDRHPSRLMERIGRQDALYFYLCHDLVIDPMIRLYLMLSIPAPYFEWTLPLAVLITALIIADVIGSLVSHISSHKEKNAIGAQ